MMTMLTFGNIHHTNKSEPYVGGLRSDASMFCMLTPRQPPKPAAQCVLSL